MCDCIEVMNARLSEHNSRLVDTLVVRNGQLLARAHLTTKKINPRNRDVMGALATFCPFCGEGYDAAVAPEARATAQNNLSAEGAHEGCEATEKPTEPNTSNQHPNVSLKSGADGEEN